MNAETRHGVVRLDVALPAAWADSTGMLTVAYCTAAFDLGIDALKQIIGLDEPYRRAARRSTVALEAHLNFITRVPLPADVVIESRIVDRDGKRLHTAQALWLGDVLAATREGLTISFDLEARRSCPFDAGIQVRIDALYDAQRALPPPAATSRVLDVGRVT